jgi:hypothetical protein
MSATSMEPGSLVIVNCLNPQEKLWGLLLRLDVLGAVVRGLNLSSREDWLAQEKAGKGGFVMPSTVFVPMHRVERIYLDESSPAAPSFGSRFLASCGRDVAQALMSGECEGSS